MPSLPFESLYAAEGRLMCDYSVCSEHLWLKAGAIYCEFDPCKEAECCTSVLVEYPDLGWLWFVFMLLFGISLLTTACVYMTWSNYGAQDEEFWLFELCEDLYDTLLETSWCSFRKRSQVVQRSMSDLESDGSGSDDVLLRSTSSRKELRSLKRASSGRLKRQDSWAAPERANSGILRSSSSRSFVGAAEQAEEEAEEARQKNLRVGMCVEAHNLVVAAQFNGRTGKLLEYDALAERWQVDFGDTRKKIKAENLTEVSEDEKPLPMGAWPASPSIFSSPLAARRVHDYAAAAVARRSPPREPRSKSPPDHESSPAGSPHSALRAPAADFGRRTPSPRPSPSRITSPSYRDSDRGSYLQSSGSTPTGTRSGLRDYATGGSPRPAASSGLTDSRGLPAAFQRPAASSGGTPRPAGSPRSTGSPRPFASSEARRGPPGSPRPSVSPRPPPFGHYGDASSSRASPRFMPGAAQEFNVKITKREGIELGIDVDPRWDDHLLKIAAVGGGLVAEWNNANPNKQVEVGDCIVAVNGASGTGEQLIQRVKEDKYLNMAIRRQVERPSTPELPSTPPLGYREKRSSPSASASASRGPSRYRAVSPASGAALDTRPVCKFGANCFRKNPDHLREFRH